MRVHATDEKGERFLRYITCDAPGCENKIAPHPEVVSSGWVKSGAGKEGDWLEHQYCPEHAGLAGG